MILPWKKHLKRIGALIVLGAVIVPIAAYLVGGTVVGPYQGDGGLTGYLGAIYLSAWRGERAALTLILTPLAVFATWLTALWLLRYER